MPDPEPEPLPPGGYDHSALAAWQGDPAAPRCHCCGGPKSWRNRTLVCRVCDGPPLTNPSE